MRTSLAHRCSNHDYYFCCCCHRKKKKVIKCCVINTINGCKVLSVGVKYKRKKVPIPVCE